MKRVLVISCLILLTLACVLSVPNTAYAADVVAAGYCGASGSNLTWILDSDGVLSITGSGAMKTYSLSSRETWYYYRISITAVIIGENVTSIGSYAFSDCTELTSITIPESVTSIGSHAFDGCTRLTSAGPIGGDYNIKIGWTESIPTSAFYGCTLLTSITIPESVTSIGSSAFSGCTGLTSINVGESVTSIGYRAFDGCTGLTDVTIPESVTSIGVEAFRNCTGLTQINYNAKNMADFNNDSIVFYNAGTADEGVTVVIGDAVETIPTELLTSDHVKEYIVNSNNESFKSIDGVLYNYTGKHLIRCPKLFNGSFVLPDSVKIINDYAFYGCTGLTDVTIPESVTSIGVEAFSNCTGLTTVTIGESVTNIGDLPFYWCTGLTQINYNAKNVTSGGDFICPNAGTAGDGITVVFGDAVETIPEGMLGDYSGVPLPKITSVRFLGDIPEFGNMCFEHHSLIGYYPYGNTTWNNIPNSIGGGYVKWVAYSLGEPISAEMAQMSYRTEFEKNSAPDFTGLALNITFTDGFVERHELSDLEIISYDFSKLGKRPVTVAYKGLQHVFYVTVIELFDIPIDSSEYPQSPHPYDNDMDETYTYSYPGAEKIEFTFSENTSFEDQVDYLYVFDCNDNLVATYTKKQAAGQKVTINGDTFKIKLTSDESYTEYGFAIDSIVVKEAIGSCKNGHTYSVDVEYVWSADYSSVSAGHVCIYCGEKDVIENAPSTFVSTATCLEDGTTTYTAVFENTAFESQIKTITAPALGHCWLAPSWFWADDYTTASAVFVCALCTEEARYDAEININGETYTAKVTGPDGEEYTDTKVVKANDFVLGDVTGDGEVTADDLTRLSRHVARIDEFDDGDLLKAADVNKDNKVTADDLTMLSRYVAKIINSFE